MGDRANIVIKSGKEQVCLYTHWNGNIIDEMLREALVIAIEDGRIDDYQYLNRIIFCTMTKDEEWDSTTGYGITQEIHDGKSNVITLDLDKETIVHQNYGDYTQCSIEDFITLGSDISEDELEYDDCDEDVGD